MIQSIEVRQLIFESVGAYQPMKKLPIRIGLIPGQCHVMICDCIESTTFKSTHPLWQPLHPKESRSCRWPVPSLDWFVPERVFFINAENWSHFPADADRVPSSGSWYDAVDRFLICRKIVWLPGVVKWINVTFWFPLISDTFFSVKTLNFFGVELFIFYYFFQVFLSSHR